MRQVKKWKGHDVCKELFSNDANDMHVLYTWRDTRIDTTDRSYSHSIPFIHQQS
jgi:hypothetical protein